MTRLRMEGVVLMAAGVSKYDKRAPGSAKRKHVPMFTANLQVTKVKQQWCYLCHEVHDFHKST